MAKDVVVFPERPRVAVACGSTLGEGPVWDHRTGTLFWVDIKGHKLWRWQPDGGEPATDDLDEPVAFVKLGPDPDTVILGLKSGIARHRVATRSTEILLRPETDLPGNRLNDADVGPDGSLYFGSMDDAEENPTGRFYRWSVAGLHRFGGDAVVTNGPTVDAVRGLLYAADTTNGRVYRHRLATDGSPEERELFVEFDEGAGHPDGLTIDADGCLWVCHFGGSRVTRFSRDGEALLEVALPTAQVTKVAFGGPDLGTMFITTAAVGRDRQIDLHAGHLFAVETGIRGVEAAICQVAT